MYYPSRAVGNAPMKVLYLFVLVVMIITQAAADCCTGSGKALASERHQGRVQRDVVVVLPAGRVRTGDLVQLRQVRGHRGGGEHLLHPGLLYAHHEAGPGRIFPDQLARDVTTRRNHGVHRLIRWAHVSKCSIGDDIGIIHFFLGSL